MDIALLNNGRNRAWSETMVNLEARKLVETANQLSAFYLHGRSFSYQVCRRNKAGC